MKKGYLRTLEAVIAIILLFLFMYAITPRPSAEVKVPEGIRVTQKAILNGIQQDDELREVVSRADPDSNENSKLFDFINSNLPFGFDYNIVICKAETLACDKCKGKDSANKDIIIGCPAGPELPDKTVYARSILITTPNSRIIRLYLWEK